MITEIGSGHTNDPQPHRQPDSEACSLGRPGSAPLFFRVEVPGNEHSNEVQLIAGLERLTDIAIDWSKPDAAECAARAASWYFDRYGKPKNTVKRKS